MAYSVDLQNVSTATAFATNIFNSFVNADNNHLSKGTVSEKSFVNEYFNTNVTSNNVYYYREGFVNIRNTGATNKYGVTMQYLRTPFIVDDNVVRPFFVISNINSFANMYIGISKSTTSNYIFDTNSYGALNTENRFLFDDTDYIYSYTRLTDKGKDVIEAEQSNKNKASYFRNYLFSAFPLDVRCLDSTVGGWNMAIYSTKAWLGQKIDDRALTLIDTNIPFFYQEDTNSIINWVNNGDRSGEVPKALSTTTNFNLWIKGLDAPSYKLNWHNDELESDNFDFSNSDVTISVKRDDLPFYREVFKVPYTDGSIYFTYYDLLDALEHDDSILFPWLDFSATVTYRKDFDDATPYTSGRPSVDLRRKAPNFDSMYKDLVSADDGSSINVINYENDPSGYDSNEDDYHDPSDNTDDTPDPTEELTVVNNLSKCYVIDSLELSKLSSFLWGAGFLDNIKLINNNPIENIVSLKAIIGTVSGGDSQTLTLGNVQTTSNVRKCNETLTIDVGSFTVPKKYNNFLDFAPYTKVQIYLPFFGTTNLDSSLVVGRTINIKYIIDVVTGTAKIKILHDSKTLYEFKCSCGADLPITSSNRASVEMGYISSGIGLVGSIASGNVIGATMSLLNMAQSQFHSQTSGNCNGILNFHDSREVTILVDRPIYTELKNFNATKGRMCNLSLSLKNLNGFTQCDGNVRLNFDMLAEEETMLRDLMSSGIIL